MLLLQSCTVGLVRRLKVVAVMFGGDGDGRFAPQLVVEAGLAEIGRLRSALAPTARVDAVNVAAVQVDLPLPLLSKLHLFSSHLFFGLQRFGKTTFRILQTKNIDRRETTRYSTH